MVSEYTVTFYIQPADIFDDNDTADGEFWVRDANDGELLANNSGPWSLNHLEDITIDIDSHPVIEFEIEAQSSSPGSVDFDWAIFSYDMGTFAQITADDSELPITEVGVWDTRPPSPNIDSVSSTAGEVDLSWSHPDANDYEILRAESTGSNPLDYSPVGTTSGLTTFTDTSLEDGERYYYRVRAVYPGTDSQPTNEVDATTPLPTPALDALDTATAREIVVEYTLTDNSSDGDLTIERSDDGGLTWTTVTTVTNLSTTEYTDSGLLDGMEYAYRLTRETDHASVQSGTLPATTILPAPTGLEALDTGDESIDIVWDATHNTGQTRVDYRETGANEWETFGIVARDTVTETITGLLNGEEYELRVVAVTDDAEEVDT